MKKRKVAHNFSTDVRKLSQVVGSHCIKCKGDLYAGFTNPRVMVVYCHGKCKGTLHVICGDPVN